MKKLIAIVPALLLTSTAFAKFDGRSARSAVLKNYGDKGLSQDVRVHSVRSSHSGKSDQVLVETRGSGTVRAFNVQKDTRVARETPTGLMSQKSARGEANQDLRREPGVRWNKKQPGTFSGVNSSGLSTTGKTYKITSNTDRNGKWHTNNTYVSPTTKNAITIKR